MSGSGIGGGAAAGAGWTKIETISITSSTATIDFTTSIDGTYDAYMVMFSEVRCDGDGRQLWIRTSSDSGLTWDSGAGNYGYSLVQVNGTIIGGTGSGSATHAIMNPNPTLGNGVGENASGRLYLFAPSGTLFTHFEWTLNVVKIDGTHGWTAGSGHRNSAADVNGLRILPSFGNFTDGEFTMYGLVK